jgi:platelet-activating factor acetylhydrolase IB subunit alpha
MVLTDRQRSELHSSIYEYLLGQNGVAYRRAAEALAQADPSVKNNVGSPSRSPAHQKNETGENVPPKVPLLERKWTAVTKLQQKVYEMEKLLETRQHNERVAVVALPTVHESIHEKRFLPRSPCTYSLQGHSAVVTCVALHPIFTFVLSGGEDSAIKVGRLFRKRSA